MRKVFLISMATLALLIIPSLAPAQMYQTGDTLRVIANSGLRLRTSPHTESGTIRILKYGEPVSVLNTFNFDDTHADQSGWLSGHWIYVRSSASEGFIFDAYLTTLDIPTHEDELCYEPMRFTSAMQTYINHHYGILADENGLEQRDEVDQCVTYRTDNITMTITQGNGWYKTDIEFGGYRLSEVINLMRSMLVGTEVTQTFEDSLVFYRDKYSGQVTRIRGGSPEYPVIIEWIDDGIVTVSLTEYITG